MEFFRIKRDIPFMRHALVFNIISLITFIAAVVSLSTRGLHLSIEFTGGTQMEVTYSRAPDVDKIRAKLTADGYKDAEVQNFGSSTDFLIRVPLAKQTSSSAVADRILTSLKTIGGKPEMKKVEYVGPQVGKELASDGAMALLLVVIGIMIYLAIRFEWRFAVSAIIANLHDVVIILGFFSFFQWEFSLPVLAAVLAVLGYSVNESVVVFDRVRETFRRKRGMTTPEVLNHAITSTMSRTVITHLCTQMMATSMLFFGGTALHYFALALTIGILFGIYSSVLVASPLVMWLGVTRAQFARQTKKKEEAVV